MKMKEVLRTHPSGSPIGFLGHFRILFCNLDNDVDKTLLTNDKENSDKW